MHNEFSAEHRLLLASARVHVDDSTRTRLQQLIAQGIDWRLVARSSSNHGIGPLVLRTLISAGVMGPDDERIALLRHQAFANAANSLLLSRELIDLLRRFNAAGVAAVPYKGPILAALLYHDLALREFTDLDILVKPPDVPKARDVLQASGYEPEFVFTPSQEKRLVASRAGYFLRFDRPNRAGRVVLELHWRIPATFPLGDGFWDRLRPARLLDCDVQHFTPEDLLLILCAHGFKHGWAQLKWLCDVHELLSAMPLDWGEALDRARRLGGLRIMLVGCALAHSLLGAELPAPVESRIQADTVAAGLAATFHRRNEHPSPHVGLSGNLQIRERVQDKVRYGLGLLGQLTVPDPAERVMWPTWPGAGVVYGLAHPFRVAGHAWTKHRR